MRLRFAGTLAALALVVAGSGAAAGEDAAASAQRGKAVFEQNCVACHGADATGGFGPALKPIAARKDKRPVQDIVKAPGPDMPPLYPASLTDDNVADVAAYISSLQ